MIGCKLGRGAGACCNGWALAGLLVVSAGLLTQPGGASWFLIWVAFVLLLAVIHQVRTWPKLPRKEKPTSPPPPPAPESEASSGGSSTATATIVIAGLLALGMGASAEQSHAAESRGADSIAQQWAVRDGRLTATATISITAREGDSFEILRSPATLTSFEGEGLQLRKREVSGEAVYLLVPEAAGTFTGTATYEIPVDLAQGITLPTGAAAVQTVEVRVAQAGWEFNSPQAVRVEPLEAAEGESSARLVLRPEANAAIGFRLAGRDIDSEETRYFAETQNAFICGPGVVDARHYVVVRPSQGKVSRMKLNVPDGFTVSAVDGPVGQWRFDPDRGRLRWILNLRRRQHFSCWLKVR